MTQLPKETQKNGDRQTNQKVQIRQRQWLVVLTIGVGGFGGKGAIPLPRCQTLCNMTLKQHNPGVHCNKKHQRHQIMPFIFTCP